ncbi:MAG: glycosyltransferase family 2 protein, partial [Bacteroidota bacterium]
MLRPPLSVTIITLNEEKNIARAIQSVKGLAQEVLVVDSGSQDRTKEIARDLGARVLENPWPGYGQQKNFAQNQTTYDWVLNIDADEELSRELALEIQNVLEKESDKSVKGYLLPRLSFYLGQWIRHGGWYPNRQLRL